MVQDAEPPSAAAAAVGESDPSLFKGKKGKLANKAVRAATQWEIMRLSGVPEEEIASFADPSHWLTHFPPLGAMLLLLACGLQLTAILPGMRDVSAMGCGVDWRRTFITTDANPYYDTFVRWQACPLSSLLHHPLMTRFAVQQPSEGGQGDP